MDQPPGEESPRCPVCGAALQAGMAACAACGTPLTGMFPAPSAITPPTAMPASSVAPGASPDPACVALANDASGDLEASAGAGDMWRCDWCGKANPMGIDQCDHCGAMFPRPEADAALTRLAEERMRAELATLDTMQRRRQHKGLGRLFSN